MRAVTIDSDLATLFTFTPRKTPITPIHGVGDYSLLDYSLQYDVLDEEALDLGNG